MDTTKIQEVIERIKNEPCLVEETTFPLLEEYLQDIVAVYMSLIHELPDFKAKGIELPEDVILQQVKNLEDAVAHQDLIKLYDTLKFEVLNTFTIYYEIKAEMGQ